MANLEPSELLHIPKRRRLTHARLKADDGGEVLHLFYGDVELIFDEPDLAPVGQKLIEVEQFRAEEAMAWSDAGPHAWDRVRDLLQALIDQQVLSRVADSAGRAKEAYPERLGLVPEGREPRTFSGHDDRCPVLTEEAFGRALDLSNLEVLVPVYRTGHPALDAEGRQVGENNVGPRTLFLDLPTQRKLCSYPGSRYQHELPMNVTAMKLMSRRWPELLSLTEQLREAVVARMPLKDPGSFAAGEIHIVAVCVLASVGYVMVRGVNPTPNGQLDAGLAASFRLIDGVRLVTNDFVRSLPDGKGCELPITARTIHEHAERHAIFRGNFGVCAGPPALIDEYLQVLFGETKAPIEADPDVATRLGDLEAALDYGFLGQRVESVVRFLGASEGLLHERLRAAFAGHAPRTALQELVEAPIDTAHYPLLREDFSLEETFRRELDLSRWLFARIGDALVGKVEPGSLDELLRLDPAEQAASRRRLAELFAHGLPADRAVKEPLCGELAAVAAAGFALERRCLRLLEREQGLLNQRLQRKAGAPLTNVDLAAFTRPRNGPPLAETLARGLGVTATSDASATVLRLGELSLRLTDQA